MSQFEKEYYLRLRRMEKMSEILNYLLARLEEPLTAEMVAAEFGYNKKYFEKIFAEYFEMPFHRFLKKIRLRKAAEALVINGTVKEQWRRYGFESKISFSSAFKKEFGESPRMFLGKGRPVPSMPERISLCGIPIRVEYQTAEEMVLKGFPINPVHGAATDLLMEAAYALEHPDPHVELDKLTEWYGIWWFDFEQSNQLYYLIASDTEEGFVDCHLQTVVIPADEYAVFSYERRDTSQENMMMSRLLARYALTEWKLLTSKRTNPMGWTFERFGQERNYLYIPVTDQAEEFAAPPNTVSGVDTWASYIDRHIKENLTLTSLAEMAHYTEKSFRDIFTMYYAIDPMRYVQKRRLYEAAGELSRYSQESDEKENRNDKKTLKKLARKYRFSSFEIFQKQFREEFQAEPEEYPSIHFEALDLKQIYQKNMEELLVVEKEADELHFIGKAIKSTSSGEDDQDVSVLAAYWFREDYPEMREMLQGRKVAKAAIWDTRKDEKAGEDLYEYMLGPVTSDFAPVSPGKLPDSFVHYHLEGGRYMVFSTKEESDLEHLTAAFRLLTRCAFLGWIRDHFYRYDGERLTYVRYEREKLYFYVPVKG